MNPRTPSGQGVSGKSLLSIARSLPAPLTDSATPAQSRPQLFCPLEIYFTGLLTEADAALHFPDAA